MQKQVVTKPGGTPKWIRDVALNDSDKSFTVPTGKMWMPHYIRARLTASATVGSRYLNCRFKPDGTNVQFISPNVPATATQVAVLLLVHNQPYNNTNILTNDVGDGVNASTSYLIPQDICLPAGGVIQILDYAAIDAAADDLSIDIFYTEYEA